MKPTGSSYERGEFSPKGDESIFLLPQYALALEKAMAVTTGDEEIDMTSSGLWPSDHAGVIGRIKFSQVE